MIVELLYDFTKSCINGYIDTIYVFDHTELVIVDSVDSRSWTLMVGP